MMKNRTQGFTLIEMMVVVAIIGILAAIAYPSYAEHVARGKRADARATLLEAAQFMERYYVAQSSYEAAVLPARLAVSPAGATSPMYSLGVVSSAGAYTLTATPVAPDTCGALVLGHTGTKTRLGMGLSDRDCWR